MGYTILTLEQDNPCNTTIVDELKDIVYVVDTDLTDPSKPTTHIKGSDEKIIASWVWRDIRSDVLTYGNLPPVSASSWVSKSIVPFSDTATFRDHTQGREFKWTNLGAGMWPQLFGPSSKTEPVARFEPSRRDPSVGVLPARLFISDNVEYCQDEIVVSFLLLERRRRTHEADGAARADSIALSASYGGSARVR
ncbi:hypothetical protein K488DRAFT_84043 [Vararia minispora EC-137]|uniref:Uncharacterized protein n=1 Tax=Vararia minispora EC-137 TaxID=1314806 RepID=A0ACB8QSA4_9AGAM|nr:hypothetical protein K488DRAFT_84043 [Vararia minispora EC-137]